MAKKAAPKKTAMPDNAYMMAKYGKPMPAMVPPAPPTRKPGKKKAC